MQLLVFSKSIRYVLVKKVLYVLNLKSGTPFYFTSRLAKILKLLKALLKPGMLLNVIIDVSELT